jgi:hypothetical protein
METPKNGFSMTIQLLGIPTSTTLAALAALATLAPAVAVAPGKSGRSKMKRDEQR